MIWNVDYATSALLWVAALALVGNLIGLAIHRLTRAKGKGKP